MANHCPASLSIFEPLALPAPVMPAGIRGMLQVRDAVREVFRTQLSDGDDRSIVEARNHLNRIYDFLDSGFGPFNARESVKAFAGDPDHPLLLSFEEFDPEAKRATKTPISNRRTLERYRPIERVEAASEALLISLNETGADQLAAHGISDREDRRSNSGRTRTPGLPEAQRAENGKPLTAISAATCAPNSS